MLTASDWHVTLRSITHPSSPATQLRWLAISGRRLPIIPPPPLVWGAGGGSAQISARKSCASQIISFVVTNDMFFLCKE